MAITSAFSCNLGNRKRRCYFNRFTADGSETQAIRSDIDLGLSHRESTREIVRYGFAHLTIVDKLLTAADYRENLKQLLCCVGVSDNMDR